MMNACKKLRMLPLVLALGAPVTTVFAEASSAVTSRSADALARDFGRASADAYWQRRQPTDVPAPVVNAFEATRSFLTQPPPEKGTERYGRAGGYTGMDVLQSPAWDMAEAKGGVDAVRTITQ